MNPSPQQLETYRLGQLLALSVVLADKLSKNSSLQNIFRYTKVVDYSEKGFACTQAEALLKIHQQGLVSVKEQEAVEEFLAVCKKIRSILADVTV